jgi:hypothetical protein
MQAPHQNPPLKTFSYHPRKHRIGPHSPLLIRVNAQFGSASYHCRVYGLLFQGTVGLISGKSSAAIRGLQVYPDVIDEDYTREIKIMAQAPCAFVTVSKEEKNSASGILPNVKKGKVLIHTPWRDGGFSSSEHAYWYN